MADATCHHAKPLPPFGNYAERLINLERIAMLNKLPLPSASLLCISLLALILVFCLPPLAQDPAYHAFADQRHLLQLPHFWNVVSNLPFLLAGLYGLSRQPGAAQGRIASQVFCLSLILVAAGSCWYHLQPDNARLIWDRLPMTLGFLSMFTLILQERVLATDSRLQHPWALLVFMLSIGVAAALWWYWGELHGAGDLRPYLLVQFLPLLLLPLILLGYAARSFDNRLLWSGLLLYLLAKLSEHFDHALYAASGVGGHFLKHMLAGLACLLLVHAFTMKKRVVRAARQPRLAANLDGKIHF